MCYENRNFTGGGTKLKLLLLVMKILTQNSIKYHVLDSTFKICLNTMSINKFLKSLEDIIVTNHLSLLCEKNITSLYLQRKQLSINIMKITETKLCV